MNKLLRRVWDGADAGGILPLSMSETYARIYWCCSPSKMGTANVWPTVWTARGIGACRRLTRRLSRGGISSNAFSLPSPCTRWRRSEPKRRRSGLSGEVIGSVNHPVGSSLLISTYPCQFGYRKVHYRGIAKNGAQVFSLLALANLYLARRTFASA